MAIYEFFMSPWFWLALAVLCLLAELGHFSLVTIWFALAAVAMILITGFFGLFDVAIAMKFQVGLFLAISIVLLIFTRPIAVKKLKVGSVKTNANELIGQDALITKKITKFDKGEAKIKGKYWMAVSENGEEIAEDTVCEVTEIEGVKLIVRAK